MSRLSPGKIFLADQRGLTETSSIRRYSTFNFEAYFSEYKQPFGNIYAFNEEMLAGLKSINTTVNQASYIIIIPVTGSLIYINAQGEKHHADAGNILITTAGTQSTVTITNPYEDDLITYLQVYIKAPVTQTSLTQLFGFNLDAGPHQLINVVDCIDHNLPFSINIGRFGGRKEAVYTLRKNAQLFSYVMAGAFEMQGRLLHQNDALALWDVAEADMEALSNHAIILLIELPANN